MLYTSAGLPICSTKTNGSPGARLEIDGDAQTGYPQIVRSDGFTQ